mmetsp:Transcript_8666/g.26659  ORF Transcript_8666/g.26659 Transcript_8666/m.26659 type:complete len:283 (-) Transcript_8666:415-1263(-)
MLPTSTTTWTMRWMRIPSIHPSKRMTKERPTEGLLAEVGSLQRHCSVRTGGTEVIARVEGRVVSGAHGQVCKRTKVIGIEHDILMIWAGVMCRGRVGQAVGMSPAEPRVTAMAVRRGSWQACAGGFLTDPMSGRTTRTIPHRDTAVSEKTRATSSSSCQIRAGTPIMMGGGRTMTRTSSHAGCMLSWSSCVSFALARLAPPRQLRVPVHLYRGTCVMVAHLPTYRRSDNGSNPLPTGMVASSMAVHIVNSLTRRSSGWDVTLLISRSRWSVTSGRVSKMSKP